MAPYSVEISRTAEKQLRAVGDGRLVVLLLKIGHRKDVYR
jgi:mRNA-degrading endonuclease RelE of RelBE toxin-antitoxin system